MTDNESLRMERAYPVRAIESEARGLKYIVDDDRRGLIIAGQEGKTGLSRRQAKALCREPPGLLRDYLGVEA